MIRPQLTYSRSSTPPPALDLLPPSTSCFLFGKTLLSPPLRELLLSTNRAQPCVIIALLCRLNGLMCSRQSDGSFALIKFCRAELLD